MVALSFLVIYAVTRQSEPAPRRTGRPGGRSFRLRQERPPEPQVILLAPVRPLSGLLSIGWGHVPLGGFLGFMHQPDSDANR